MLRRILDSVAKFKASRSEKSNLKNYIFSILGKKPKNIQLYELALIHTSMLSNSDPNSGSNERLEFLGDAILDMVVAEYLFKKYPFKDEGFMTEIRSRLVNGDSLHKLAMKIHLNDQIKYNTRGIRKGHTSSMLGDALEALIGAIYLDRGFKTSKEFIVNRLLGGYVDIDEVVENDTNYKSRIIDFAQKQQKKASFRTIEEKGSGGFTQYTVQIFINEIPCQIGKGTSRKRAEQEAARKMLDNLDSFVLEESQTFPPNESHSEAETQGGNHI